MIQINQLHKSFKRNEVLEGISLSINKPGITAILGPNGSGKTTLIKSLLGMVLPQKGEILFNGENIKGQHAYRKDINYLSQIARFPENLTGNELIQMMKDIRSEESREDELISLFGLENELHKKMGALSGGTRQKVNITLALMHDNPLTILDEPSVGLDPLSLRRFKEYLLNEKANGKYILITTHILSLAEDLADDVIFLLEGHIYFNGPLKDLLANEQEQNLENAIAHILSIHTEV